MPTRTVRGHITVIASLLFLLSCQGASGPAGEDVAGSTRYEDLLTLHEEWRAFQAPALTEGVPDYTAAA